MIDLCRRCYNGGTGGTSVRPPFFWRPFPTSLQQMSDTNHPNRAFLRLLEIVGNYPPVLLSSGTYSGYYVYRPALYGCGSVAGILESNFISFLGVLSSKPLLEVITNVPASSASSAFFASFVDIALMLGDIYGNVTTLSLRPLPYFGHFSDAIFNTGGRDNNHPFTLFDFTFIYSPLSYHFC